MSGPIDKAALDEAKRLALLRELWRKHDPEGREI